mgnify:CR=1 FL=1
MFNPMNLSNRIFVVTGASSGIGRDVAVFLSELGATVVLTGRNEEQLQATFNMMTENKHQIEPFDLKKVNDIPKWLKKISERIGPMDGIVHSAGIEVLRPLNLITNESFHEVMNINVNAAFGLIKGFRQKRINRSGGSIVLISSISGLIGDPAHVEYCSSKTALVGLARAAAMELAHNKIRVNCIAPGIVKSEMAESMFKVLLPAQIEAVKNKHPLGIGTLRDVAGAAAFLLADTGRWITGTTLTVDGGYTAH